MISFDSLESLEVVAMKLTALAEQAGFDWECTAEKRVQGDDEETPTLVFTFDEVDELAELCWLHEFRDCGAAIGLTVDALQRIGWEVQISFQENSNLCTVALFRPGTMDGPCVGPDCIAIAMLNVLYQLPLEAGNA